MRFVVMLLLALVGLPGCEGQRGAGGLTRRQCSQMVKHVDRLSSEDVGGLSAALHAGRGGSVDACLEQATERVFRCVMQARTADDLGPCEMLQE